MPLQRKHTTFVVGMSMTALTVHIPGTTQLITSEALC